jgi:hypothetical protein
MDDEIVFLLDAAEQLREVALTAPEIAAALRQMADELEAAATELAQNGRRGTRVRR